MDRAPLRTYGRIKTRTLKPRQAALVEGLLPSLGVPAGPFDPRTLAPGAAEVWLEIGFGGGEHLAAQAERRPDVLMIGVEPFLNGVASALRHVDERGLANVRIVQGDARDIVGRLPDASLDRLFILFPDPWPKTRHHKRRLMQPDFIAELARAARPGARLRFVTDWRDYAAWTLERMATRSDWAWTAEGPADWREPPADHVTTRYEQKALGDTAPIFLDFIRA
ncbi:MAG TPA: tRNA (guanosine(46)-N7)-methyltransferase TrmB [Caulobacteraceae bacterium]|jgi:tRNA (guanine-N7-)-methyltransferase|nr:tRNA (guanosine(46)-N7)-methyltransferase TrmB [Caulobacteraceae bacterium]